MKKLLAVLLAVMICALPMAAMAEQVQLTMGSWRTDDAEQVGALLAKYEELTGVKIVFEPTTSTQYNATLRLQLDNGTGPDLFYSRSYSTGAELSEAGFNVVCNDIPGVKENFTESALSAFTDSQGNVFAVPFAAVSHFVYYNKAIFEEQGIEVPTTFEEFLDVCQKLKDAGIQPLSNGIAANWDILECVLLGMVPNYITAEERPAYETGEKKMNDETWVEIYTDFALYTKNQQLAEEANSVFDFIEYPYRKPQFDNLLVSPITARQRLYSLIDEEIFNAQCGREASITLKVNNLVDKGLVNRLYEAADSGVKIRMIIRGMCSLVTGHKNIRAISIVDRFLEHPRVMIFWNGGSPKYFISSADWMTRNLDYRIEVGTPIFDSRLQRRISRIVEIQLADNTKARVLDEEQTNEYVKKDPEAKPIRSQMEIYNYLSDLEERLKNGENV